MPQRFQIIFFDKPNKYTQLSLLSSFFSFHSRSWVFGWPIDTGTRKILALIPVHSFEKITRRIFRILTLFTANFKLTLICLFKETVSEKLYYRQWNYIFLLLCFSKCFSFSIAEKKWKLVLSSEPQWYL